MVPNHRLRRFWFDSSERKPAPDLGRSRMMLPAAYRPFPIPAEARIHALLHERLTALRRPPRSLWSRIWQFVRGIKA
jgi:hypothetical protein